MNFLLAAIVLTGYSLIVSCMVAFLAQRCSKNIRESGIIGRTGVTDITRSHAVSKPGNISDVQNSISAIADKITTNIQNNIIRRKKKTGIFVTLFEIVAELAHAVLSPAAKRKQSRHFNALV